MKLITAEKVFGQFFTLEFSYFPSRIVDKCVSNNWN
jgi:hypothetical protein